MAEVKVLVEGYAKNMKNGWLASSTVTLVKSIDRRVVVDPGCNRGKLLGSLRKENLGTGDIDFVLVTHNHLDHCLLSGIFENARILDYAYIYRGDEFEAHHNQIHGTDLRILRTPGHASDHCSLIVRSQDGTYVVAGDLFWWMDGEEQNIDIERKDPAHPANMNEMIRSRRKALEIADYIIPGHGKTLKVSR